MDSIAFVNKNNGGEPVVGEPALLELYDSSAPDVHFSMSINGCGPVGGMLTPGYLEIYSGVDTIGENSELTPNTVASPLKRKLVKVIFAMNPNTNSICLYVLYPCVNGNGYFIAELLDGAHEYITKTTPGPWFALEY